MAGLFNSTLTATDVMERQNLSPDDWARAVDYTVMLFSLSGDRISRRQAEQVLIEQFTIAMGEREFVC